MLTSYVSEQKTEKKIYTAIPHVSYRFKIMIEILEVNNHCIQSIVLLIYMSVHVNYCKSRNYYYHYYNNY